MFVEAANACSVEAPANINEWIVSGLTPEPSVTIHSYLSLYLLSELIMIDIKETISVPRVQESAVSFECEVRSRPSHSSSF